MNLNQDLLNLFRMYIPARIAEDLCSVQPITKEMISDPTRGWENIFTISYWSLKYEAKQEMTWEDEGGLCLAN